MRHSTPLARLPDSLVFPPDLASRICYDAAKHILEYDGVMYKAEFDRLLELSDDWAYRRALDDLFRLSVPEQKPGAILLARVKTMSIAGLAIAAAASIAWFLYLRFFSPEATEDPLPTSRIQTGAIADADG